MANEILENEKELSLTNQLYLIAVDRVSIPFLINKSLVLIYRNKQDAEIAANKFSKSYNNTKIKALLIQNNKDFFKKMFACGFNTFLLDGNGKTGRFSDFIDANKIKKNSTASKANKNNIEHLQPTRPIVEPKGINGLIESVKRLPKIHKTRLITAYILGFLGVAASVISLVIEDMSNVAMFVMVSLWLSVFGLANMDKVSRKVKQKNPKASMAAKPFLILILIQVVIYIFKFINA